MRSLALLALAVGVAAGLSPCAAQDAAGDQPQTSSVAKQAAPERLAPPQADVIAAQEAPATPAAIQPSPAPSEVPVHVYATIPQPMTAVPTSAAPIGLQSSPDPQSSFASAQKLLDWVTNYRKHPNVSRVPAAVHAMNEFGLFGDEDKEWFCIGFIAGVLGTNPKDGPSLIPRMFPLPDKEQAVVIRAIAYSGRPDWRDLLEKNAARMPLRRPLIDDFLQGKRPTLMELPLDQGGSSGIYALWGYYVATGQHEPVVRIMQALQWSRNKDDHSFSFKKIFSGWGSDASAVDKITTGGTAKWTLASYAERDRELLDLYRAEVPRQPENIAAPLKDVIAAAEAFESETVRKDQFGAIEDAQKAQMSNEAGMSKGATAGSIAIATGCVAATALGQPEIAIPCVIGGALYTGAVKLSH
ncbi:hypothetical protein [Methyloceanibacter sp.]|uniref:hypothetical protein n=1 Tax=Methyloceanibacter sp. TaxID=1965321 RepID=UPI002D6DE495|nr:hypothetical protein [Methyloceanibacter sp.]HZP10224.1 hypothetical protein [Methyloceanibacter sp.]